jgi:hypothetical protein
VRAGLDPKLVGWASGNLDDMRAQLAQLVPPGFLRDVPAAALADYPRYLRALVLRSERALRDPGKDQARMLELKPFADAWRRRPPTIAGRTGLAGIALGPGGIARFAVRAGAGRAGRGVAEAAGAAAGETRGPAFTPFALVFPHHRTPA